MYWGKSGVASRIQRLRRLQSANGYASVIHMSDTLADAVGTTTPANAGTTADQRPDRQGPQLHLPARASSAAPTSPACPPAPVRSPRESGSAPRPPATVVLGWGIRACGRARWSCNLAQPAAHQHGLLLRRRRRDRRRRDSDLPMGIMSSTPIKSGARSSMSMACWMAPTAAAR